MAFCKRNLEQLSTQTFDVVIVGGGISGAWLALHCAQSGLSTALVEKGDFAAQTSSASSKLLHSGIRYLQQMQFGKVRESALERAHYLYAAPHMSLPIPFAVPTYKNFQRSKLFLGCGMVAYHALCLGENGIIESTEQQLPRTTAIGASKLNKICDLSMEDHTGAVVFYERQMINSERMVLAILQTASEHGAQIVNYVVAKQLLRKGDQVQGIVAKDLQTNTELKIQAKLVINAAGPWIDSINSGIKKLQKPSINGFAIGSHIITRQLSDHAIAFTTKHQSDAKIDRGGRHVFVIPWRGYSLIGTSYDECEAANPNLSLKSSHVQQLLEVINDSIPNAHLTAGDLISGYSGLYPLRTENIDSAVYQGSGEYQIIDHESTDEIKGLITALGAKFTTGRKLSALTMKFVQKKIAADINISKTKLHSSQYQSLADYSQQQVARYADLLPSKTVHHLISHYGSEIESLMARVSDQPKLLQPICNHLPDIMGQVVWAIEQEQAINLEDVLFRRTSIGFLGLDDAAIKRTAALMAVSLNWNEEKLNQQVAGNQKRLAHTKQALINAINA